MLAAFFHWWFGQLADLLPDWLRSSGLRQADALVIAPLAVAEGSRRVRLGMRRNGKETVLGEYGLDEPELERLELPSNAPAILRLAQKDVLEKVLTLPLAAQPRLEQVLAFEMDRETPFAPDEVYWNHRIEETDRTAGRFLVRLVLLPKLTLAPWVSALQRIGITARWAEIGDGSEEDPVLPLPVLPLSDSRAPSHRPSRRLVWPATALCATLAIGAVVVPFVRQAMALAALDREIAAGRSAAAEAEKLRADIAQLSSGSRLIEAERNKSGRPIEIVATVTRLLPDDTYLTELNLRERKLSLTGRSAGAARLLGILAGDGNLRDPVFTAPVTRVEGSRAEVFSLAASVGVTP